MSESENNGHERKRLRAACTEAVRARGVNIGHVAEVVDIFNTHGLLNNSVRKKRLRKDLAQHRGKWISAATVPVTLPLDSGEEFTWNVATPHAIFQHFVSSVPNVEDLFNSCVSGKPLCLTLYHDEVTPGNILSPDPSRKCCCFYISCLDWKHALHSEFAWFPIGILRSSIIRQTSGGLSNIVRKLLRTWDDGRHGLPLNFPKKGLQIISFQLSACIMDEAAMREMWQFKGASGRKPCGLCKNVISKSVASQIESTHFVGLDCSQIDCCQFVTNEEVWEAHDHLQSIYRNVPKKTFESMQSNLGLNYNSIGVLADVTLRNWVFPTSACYDVLHCFFSNGLVAVECGLFLKLLQDHGLEKERIQSQIGFSCCSLHEMNVAQRRKLLSDPYFSERNVWKAAGSEILGMLPLLHYWYIFFLRGTEVANSCSAACQCFESLCERIFSLVKLLATNNNRFCDLLEVKQQKHHSNFSKLYGCEAMKPKHHYALHIPKQWRKYGFVLDTKVTERKHQTVKREVVSSLQNLDNFEDRALVQMVACQEMEMRKAGEVFWMTSLLNPTSLGLEHFESPDLKTCGGFIWKKGMPMLANDLSWCGIVQKFQQNGANITCFVHLLDLREKLATGIYCWKKTENEKAFAWTTGSVHCPTHWLHNLTMLTTLW